MKVFVEIHREDQTIERVAIPGERAILGRSLKAQISLPDARELDAEHVLLAPQDEGCWVAVAKGASTPVVVLGQPFDHGLVPWGSELIVGGLTLRVVKEDTSSSRKGRIHPALVASMLLIAPAAGWVILSPGADDSDLRPRRRHPELFGPAPRCPLRGDSARTRARDALAMARTRADRYPFDPQDGVKAVEGYALALSCFEAAIDPESVVTAVQEASALQTRIDEDYHAHRVRLDRSIEQKDYQAALVEVRTLIALVRHREGPYLALLEQTERRLRLRVAESKTKR